MKSAKTADELRTMILAELAEHATVPPGFEFSVIPDGDTFRAMAAADRDHAEFGEFIAKAVEIGDRLAHNYRLAAASD